MQQIDSVPDAEPFWKNKQQQYSGNPSATLINVNLRYDDKSVVIRGVSTNVPAGSSVAFVEPSKDVKSTTGRIICRFFAARSGSICISGADE